MRLFFLPFLVVILGCSNQSTLKIAEEQRFLTFPIYITDADADDNQLMFEQFTITRISKQSKYQQCGKAEERCVEIVPVPSQQRYGINAINVTYYQGEVVLAEAQFPVMIHKTQSGRAYYITLKPAEKIVGEDTAALEDIAMLNQPRAWRLMR